MSEEVHYKGKIKLVPKLENEDLEQQCHRVLKENGINKLESYCDTWIEMMYEHYNTYIIHDSNLYEVLSKEDVDETDVFNAYSLPDGTIGYEVAYYNGGCCFDEAIALALDKVIYGVEY